MCITFAQEFSLEENLTLLDRATIPSISSSAEFFVDVICQPSMAEPSEVKNNQVVFRL